MHSSIWFEIVFGIFAIHNVIIIHILLKDMTEYNHFEFCDPL